MNPWREEDLAQLKVAIRHLWSVAVAMEMLSRQFDDVVEELQARLGGDRVTVCLPKVGRPRP